MDKILSEKNVKMVSIAELKPWDKNPRINDEAAVKLAEVFKRVGFRGTIKKYLEVSCET